VALGDINGDGLLDLVVANDGDGFFYYSLQNQDGSFTTLAPTNIQVPVATSNLYSVYLQDLNGDLKPDLVYVASGFGNQALFVALNTGQANNWFTNAQLSQWYVAPGAAGALSLVPADLDGNGFVDLVVTDEQAGNWEIVHNRSVANLAPQVVTVDGADSTGNHFVNFQLGQINGRVFDDVTRDGNDLLSKPGRAGVTVYLDLHHGQLDSDDPRMVTGPDGYYSFSNLLPGTYQVRYADDATRRPTTAEGGVHTVDLTDAGATLTDLDFGDAVSIDRRLTIPDDAGSGDWTVLVNRGRLEVLDSNLGVVDSEPLDDLHSLKVVAADGRPSHLTLD
jgi:hypothetical protein